MTQKGEDLGGMKQKGCSLEVSRKWGGALRSLGLKTSVKLNQEVEISDE